MYLFNFVDENGNSVFYFFLKCKLYDDEEFVMKSKDKVDLFNIEFKSVVSVCILIEEEIFDEDFSFYMYRKNIEKFKKVRIV